jgi:hypothetical protein
MCTLDIECPQCGAQPNEWCRNSLGYKTGKLHWKRIWKAEGNMQIYQVNPHDVEPCRPATVKEIEAQKQRLEYEGQIEPIVVVHLGTDYTRVTDTLLRVRDRMDDWLYASAQVLAARELDWPTILVTY